MEQFRQLGEVLGGLRALMALRDEVEINPRQCRLMVDALNLAFDAVAEEIKTLLRFDDDSGGLDRWKSLEPPLVELCGIFQGGERYVRRCLEARRSSPSWWGKAAALGQNADCVELHLHDLLWCVPVVIEAIESAAEAAGSYKDRILVSKKYERGWMEPKLFQHNLGKPYLSSEELCSRLNSAWREDQWILSETIAEKKKNPSTDLDARVADLLLDPKGKPFPSSILVESPDFQVRGRIGAADGDLEAAQWMGESFAVKRVNGDLESLKKDIRLHSSISHPNVMNCICSFIDEDKKEGFMVMEPMSSDLGTHIKEICSSRKKAPFPLLVAVDTMLQITRAMEYLHSKKIYHGELNPSNIFVKPRNPNSPELGYLHVKIAGPETSLPRNSSKLASRPAEGVADPCIWHAPEVLWEQEKSGDRSSTSQRTDKADTYSFAMICFELLTGKVPFEDSHLKGDKMSQNIRAGERPLFPSHSPKFMTNLTKRCWHADPAQRPSFPSICRVLRYTKRYLVLHSAQATAAAWATPVDYFELEGSLSRSSGGAWWRWGGPRASEVPFQMYAFRVLEREKMSVNLLKDSNDSTKRLESESEAGPVWGDESAWSCHSGALLVDDGVSMSSSSSSSSSTSAAIASVPMMKTMRPVRVERGAKMPSAKDHLKSKKQFGIAKSNSAAALNKLPQELSGIPCREGRRRVSGHASDSELTRHHPQNGGGNQKSTNY